MSKPGVSRMCASIAPALPAPDSRDNSHSYSPCSANSRERRRALFGGPFLAAGFAVGRRRWVARGLTACRPRRHVVVLVVGRRRSSRRLARFAISTATRAASRPCRARGLRPARRSRSSARRWRPGSRSAARRRDAGRALVRDELEVIGLAADDGAERDQRVELLRSRPSSAARAGSRARPAPSRPARPRRARRARAARRRRRRAARGRPAR